MPAWTRLRAATEAVDRTGETLTEDDLADEFALSWADPERNARFAFDDAGEVRAWGWVICDPEAAGFRRVHLEGGVHPRWRGRGLGTGLLVWLVGRGAAATAALSPLPGWLEVHGGRDDTGRAGLFAGHGFTPLRHYLTMRRDLSRPVPDPTLPPGLAFVTFDASYDEATRQAHNEAFADHWGSQPRDVETWRQWVTGHRDFRPDLSFLVLDRCEVAGYALNAVHPHDFAALGHTEGWIHQLGVRPAWRGRGLATALLDASMSAFAADGLGFACLDVDSENSTGALGLYRRVGFAEVLCTVAWSRALP